ncbi:hypothetical protein QAD02_000198, partial [Eretmocerus hayati]
FPDANPTDATATMSPDMEFTSDKLHIVIMYFICFLIASIGNLTVLVGLIGGRYRKSRISLMICHLSIADMFVAIFTIPLEIVWRITVKWTFGNVGCKVLLFLRAFGLYLSNNILICVSLDRYFAVLHPLKTNNAHRRSRNMLAVAWISSVVCAAPQSIVFHVERHPEHENFTQCVTFGSFPSKSMETAYMIFCIMGLYFVPLVVICWVYLQILFELSSKSQDNKPVKTSSGNKTSENSNDTQGSRLRLRRSDFRSMERARSKTLRMTVKIVIAFIFCWTPYIVFNIWFAIDENSVKSVNPLVQEILGLMAVGNSCANPLVYGAYAIDFKKECCHCFPLCLPRKSDVEVNLIHHSPGSKTQIPDIKSPGVSKKIVHSVRQAVQGFFKVGSGQTKSTGLNGVKAPPPTLVSARFSATSIASNKDAAIERLPLQTMVKFPDYMIDLSVIPLCG